MEDTRFLKYKDRFKNYAILNIVASLCALIAAALFVFVECFEVKLEIAEGVEDLVLFKFSVFTDIKHTIDSLTSGNAFKSGGVLVMFGIYSIGAFALLAIFAIYALYVIIKNLFNLNNLEKFALLQYDKVKRSNDDDKRRVGGSSLLAFFLLCIILQIAALLICKFIPDIAGIENIEEYEEVSYFAKANGISWTIMFFILFTVGLIVLCTFARKIIKDVAFDIVKE